LEGSKQKPGEKTEKEKKDSYGSGSWISREEIPKGVEGRGGGLLKVEKRLTPSGLHFALEGKATSRKTFGEAAKGASQSGNAIGRTDDLNAEEDCDEKDQLCAKGGERSF